jgi:flagellar motor switch protein FliG
MARQVTGPQKAAMVLVHLGKDRASKVLRSMRESEVEDLMAEVARLGEVDPKIMEKTLTEFRDMASAHMYFAKGGLTYAREMLEESLGKDKAREIVERLTLTTMELPFEFLRAADPRQVLTFLQDEHPQTIALVMAHILPDQAALVMSGLPEGVQGEVARRVAQMDRTSPEVIRQVEAVLERKSSTLLQPTESTNAGGIQPLVEILNRSDRTTEKLILENLARTDPDLADEVRNRMFVFEDITSLEDRSIQLVLREIDSKELAVALKGVRDDVRDKVTHNMSERAGESLRDEIDLLGPVRLKQVEEAQSNIVKAIRRLEESGQIVVSRGGEEFVD